MHIPCCVYIYAPIERKTWSDLSASIIDTRAREQKHRLVRINNGSDESTAGGEEGGELRCQVMYLIEGLLRLSSDNISTHTMGGLPLTTLLGAVANTMFRDNIQVYKSESIRESAMFIIKSLNTIRERTSGTAKLTGSVLDKRLSKQFRVQSRSLADVFAAQLMQIPGVGYRAATTISKRHNSIGELAKHVSDNGKERTIGELSNLVGCDGGEPDDTDVPAQKKRKLGKAIAAKCIQCMFPDSDGEKSVREHEGC